MLFQDSLKGFLKFQGSLTDVSRKFLGCLQNDSMEFRGSLKSV